MTTKAEVYEDLKAKVEQLMGDIKKDALEKLDHLQRSGVGLLDDHEKGGMSFKTPKDFMVAFAPEIGRAYRPMVESVAWVRTIDNYRRSM